MFTGRVYGTFYYGYHKKLLCFNVRICDLEMHQLNTGSRKPYFYGKNGYNGKIQALQILLNITICINLKLKKIKGTRKYN